MKNIFPKTSVPPLPISSSRPNIIPLTLCCVFNELGIWEWPWVAKSFAYSLVGWPAFRAPELKLPGRRRARHSSTCFERKYFKCFKQFINLHLAFRML